MVDSHEIEEYLNSSTSSGIEFNPLSEKFNAELFKEHACFVLNIHDFVKEFNAASLNVDDDRYYIYLEI